MSANDAPAVTILGAPGGGTQYTAFYPSINTHTEYQLPGDSLSNAGADFPGGGIGFWYFNSYSPGANYGNPGDGLTSNQGWALPLTLSLNLNNYTSGITGNLALTSNSTASGDFTEINELVSERSARITPSDEGTYTGIHNQSSESGEYTGVVVTGGSGSTVLTLTPSAFATQTGNDSPAVDLDTAVTGTATYVSTTSDNVANITTSFTVPVGNGGTLATNVDSPRLAPNTTGKLSANLVTFGLNTSTTLTVGELCDIRGPSRNEVVKLTSAPAPVSGVQTVQAWLSFSHTAGTPYQCGGAVGNYLAMTDYEPTDSGPGMSGSHQIYYEQVYGSTGSNALIVGDRSANQFESLFPHSGTVNVSMVQGGDVVGVYDPTTTPLTIAAGNTIGTVGSCTGLAGHWVNIPGAGAPSYPVSSCSGTSITLGIAAANTVTAATVSHIPDGTYLAIMPPPSTAFGAGHHVLNANNISASVSFTAYNSFFDNPWMWNYRDIDGVYGLGGGMAPSVNVRHSYFNGRLDSDYLGATGKYYAPAWATLQGPYRGMIHADHWPVDSATPSPTGNSIPGCGGTLMCIALGFSTHATATTGVIFRDGSTGTDLRYNPTSGRFEIIRSDMGGNLSMDFGKTGLTVTNGIVKATQVPTWSTFTGFEDGGHDATAASGYRFDSLFAGLTPTHLTLRDGGQYEEAPGDGTLCIGDATSAIGAGVWSCNRGMLAQFYGAKWIGGYDDSLSPSAATLIVSGYQPKAGTIPSNLASFTMTGYSAASNPGQYWLHADNSTLNFIMDNNLGGSHHGYFGVGYTPGAAIPWPFSVVGIMGSDSYMGQAASAPSGSCATNGLWVFSQDGHATFCASGTWVTKI
jgi:hypothetical protein